MFPRMTANEQGLRDPRYRRSTPGVPGCRAARINPSRKKTVNSMGDPCRRRRGKRPAESSAELILIILPRPWQLRSSACREARQRRQNSHIEAVTPSEGLMSQWGRVIAVGINRSY